MDAWSGGRSCILLASRCLRNRITSTAHAVGLVFSLRSSGSAANGESELGSAVERRSASPARSSPSLVPIFSASVPSLGINCSLLGGVAVAVARVAVVVIVTAVDAERSRDPCFSARSLVFARSGFPFYPHHPYLLILYPPEAPSEVDGKRPKRKSFIFHSTLSGSFRSRTLSACVVHLSFLHQLSNSENVMRICP